MCASNGRAYLSSDAMSYSSCGLGPRAPHKKASPKAACYVSLVPAVKAFNHTSLYLSIFHLLSAKAVKYHVPS